MKATKKAIRALSILSMVPMAGGCASIFNSGPRIVNINSQPPGAMATISKADTNVQIHSGTTPLTVSLDPKRGFFKGQSYTVRFDLQGYLTDEVVLRAELSGWYFGNILLGGVIGMLIVDPATGAMWNITPDKLDRSLTAEQADLIRSGDGFIVSLISETSESERLLMQKLQ